MAARRSYAWPVVTSIVAVVVFIIALPQEKKRWAPPFLRTPETQHHPVPGDPLQPGQMLVVQPNVVAPDHSIGVQTGELLLVTNDGHEPLHRVSRGLLAAGTEV